VAKASELHLELAFGRGKGQRRRFGVSQSGDRTRAAIDLNRVDENVGRIREILLWLDSEQTMVAAKPECAVPVSETHPEFAWWQAIVDREAADRSAPRRAAPGSAGWIDAIDATAGSGINAPIQIAGHRLNGVARKSARLCVRGKCGRRGRGIVDAQQTLAVRSDP
jgi:hypothetical protein